MRTALLTAAILVLVPSVRAADAAADKALKELDGTYELKEFKSGGNDQTDKKKSDTITIKGGTITVKRESKEDVAKLALDPAKKHVTITTPDDNKVRLGLYKFEKGELTL